MAADVTARQAISQHLAANGTSHREFARQLGVSHNWVHRHLSGEAGFTITDLEKIAAKLGVPLTDLLPTDDSPAEVVA